MSRTTGLVIATATVGLWAALESRAAAACQHASPSSSYPSVVQDKKCENASVELTPTLVAQNFGIAPTGGDPDHPTTEPYVVYYNTAYSNQKLLVFLPGSGQAVTSYTALMLRAAYKGYRVIGMQYWQGPTNCDDGAPGREACLEDFRRAQYKDGAALDGGNAADSVRYRLRKLLQYLDAKYTGQNAGGIAWGHFLANGGDTAPYINWAAVAVGGHSTGSKLSAFIASEETVFRAFLFSGPNEYADHTAPDHPVAPVWLAAATMKTPESRIYAFSHTDDGNISEAYAAWIKMGLVGHPSGLAWNTAYTPIPNYVHKMFSMDPAALACAPGHGATSHNCQEDANGNVTEWPARFTVWDYMFTLAVLP